jgi:NAD(P)-dependent dehydrogenase (short-subunit alcohol dehydrogenase family)
MKRRNFMNSVIITGGNNGIGFYMVSQLLAEGKNVAVFDLEVDNLEELKRKYSKNLLCFICDITNQTIVNTCVEQVFTAFGSIDYAIHNACKCLFTSMENTSDIEYRNIFDVNYFGAIHIAKAVLPYMQKQKQGRIVFTSSGVGITGFINISAYASSKAAIETLAKCLNIEYENTGISFHIMHPPLTRTISSNPLPIPNEFKEDPKKVGVNLAKNINKMKFIICPSFLVNVQVRLSYLFAIKFGRLMSKASIKASYSARHDI